MIDVTLPGFDVEAVWAGACDILERVGLEVASEKVLSRLSKTFVVRDGRVCFPRELLERCAEEIRQSAPPPAPAGTPRELVIANNCFCNHYVDHRSGKARPYDVETIIRHTKLACGLAGEGLLSGRVTGYPPGVAPRLQFLTSYFIDCCYNASAGSHPLVTDRQVLSYMIQMASVMGHTQVIGVEPISPLKFAGNSVDLAVEHAGGAAAIAIDPMPIMGVTAPLDWHAAWSQSVAENVGSYALLRACGCERLGAPSFRLFLPNMATATIYFSSPQHIFALLTRRKVREFFGLDLDWGELMLVTSKQPDQQAAAEKTAGCVLAKLFDFHYVEGAGNLSMDEIFSPQQLLIDIEIRNFANAMTADFSSAAADVVDIIADGLKRGSFLQTDLTLDCFRKFAWRSELFDYTRLAGWTGRSVLQKAAERAEKVIAEYDYELAGEKRENLERIMAGARRDLAS
ncbi:MAG: trimethylamine methyltransferase family protein [Planctomycetota bacterium]|jgi:trimethylamine:corrinoid methyltransferase-like protein